MPLIAYRAADGCEVESFDVPVEKWKAWSELPLGTFVLGPTHWPAVLKRSPRGLQFFAHAPGFPGRTEPESLQHQFAKIGVVRGLRSMGVAAHLERPGVTPSGANWQADVLSNLGGRTTAIEVQWSYQHWEDYVTRTARYRESDVDCFWLVNLQQRRGLIAHRTRRHISAGFPNDQRTLNQGMFDLPMYWLSAESSPREPSDLRVLGLSRDGADWFTPEQFGRGMATAALHWAPRGPGAFEWLFDAEVAGLTPVGPPVSKAARQRSAR